MPGVKIPAARLAAHRRFSGNQNQRYARTVVAVQLRRDGVREVRVIAQQCDGIDLLQF